MEDYPIQQYILDYEAQEEIMLPQKLLIDPVHSLAHLFFIISLQQNDKIKMLKLHNDKSQDESRQYNLSLYFREIKELKSKTVSCIEIYENFLYVGTREFLAYAYQINQHLQTLAIQLINERPFLAQCKQAQFIVASDRFLIIVPHKEQQLIRLWDRTTLQITHGYFGHDQQITSIVFMNDYTHLASSSHDGTIRVWNISYDAIEDQEVSKYTNRFGLLTLVELDRSTLAFGGDDCVVTIWNWTHNFEVKKIFAHPGSVTSLSISQKYLLYSFGGDSTIKTWEINKDEENINLFQLNQLKKSSAQTVFTNHVSDRQLLAVDSRGHTYLLSNKFQLSSSQLKINYTQSITSIKLWKNRFFVIVNCNGKGELKEIAVNLEQLRNNLKCKGLNNHQNLKISQNQMDHPSINIYWKSLKLTDPKTGALILNDLSGSAETGNFLSIMGPSGAGKSSLLSILTCRLREDNSKLKIQGQILMNGESYSLSDFSSIAAYVQQDDVLFGTLTVRETFAFQAKLKLWSSTPQIQEEKCNQMLQKLNLIDCADTLVGNSQFKKCISGGQKKRVAIGVELLSNPQILVFDEPTSGLDSHNALNITRLLSKLAKQENKLVIATIHQPSTLIFQGMDQLYLLKGGQRIYHGKSSGIVPYMQTIGVKVNYRMNPADFFMLEISTLKEQSGYISLMNSQNYEKHFAPIEEVRSSAELDSSKAVLKKRNHIDYAPFWKQFWPLFDRGFKNFYRTPSNQLNKVVIGILIPIFFGLLYKNILGQVPAVFNQSYLIDIFCFLFMSHFIIFSMNIYETALVFPTEKQIVCKQSGSNLYSIIVYFLAKFATQLFGCVIPAITSGIIIFFAGGLNFIFSHFAVYMGIFILLAIAGFLFGLMYGVLNKSSQKAITILPLAVIPMMIFGGLIIKINDMPVYSQWLQYLSPLRHSFIILFQDQLSSPNMASFQNLGLPSIYGLDGDPYIAFGCLIGLMGLYLVLSLVLLIILKKRI